MRDYSFQITKTQYDYLLPVLGNSGTKQLMTRMEGKVEKHFFTGTEEGYKDLLDRCRFIK